MLIVIDINKPIVIPNNIPSIKYSFANKIEKRIPKIAAKQDVIKLNFSFFTTWKKLPINPKFDKRNTLRNCKI